MTTGATGQIADATAHGWLRAGTGALAIAVMVSACAAPQTGAAAAPGGTPEIYELANMRPGNVVPKSSPSALVKAFQSYCLNGSHDAARVAASLHAADYVAVPQTAPNGITAYVVDDSRPMVMVSNDGRTCAVGAASRTGQSARIQSMIAARFPGATALDPASVSPNTELAVQAPGAGVIFVQRLVTTIANSRLILGVWRAI